MSQFNSLLVTHEQSRRTGATSGTAHTKSRRSAWTLPLDRPLADSQDFSAPFARQLNRPEQRVRLAHARTWPSPAAWAMVSSTRISGDGRSPHRRDVCLVTRGDGRHGRCLPAAVCHGADVAGAGRS